MTIVNFGGTSWKPILLLLFCALVASGPLAAQGSRVSMLDFATGSEYESYLRVLQVAGIAPLHPWSIRGFSRREITKLASADSTGPWRLKERLSTAPLNVGPLRLGAILNSAFPYGANDGPVWAGRGLTAVVSGGVSLRLGPISIAVDPIAFSAANTQFELLPNTLTGAQTFNRGGTFARLVDLPQRFGSERYSRVDPGASQLRFDSRLVTFGVSTANQWIGPATEYPFILGTNAPGFPHIFLGTGEPLNVWIGRLHARFMWGRLHQSDYSPVTGPAEFSFDTAAGAVTNGGTVRLTASGQFVLVPRGAPGLEIGIARFFHVPNVAGEPNGAFWRKPLKVLFLENELAQGDLGGFDNQLASAFFRWVLPRGGFEVFGERGFEDQLYDLRDLILSLDHEREYMFGFQRALRRPRNRLDVLRFELVNFQAPTLARVRGEGGVYVHATLRQGHTNRGQLLGASPGAGWAAASTLSWTRYSPSNRTSATVRRIVRDQRGDFHLSGVVDPRGSDVIIAAGIERKRFGRRVDVGAHLEVMQDFNRNFSRDVPSLNLQLNAQLHPW